MRKPARACRCCPGAQPPCSAALGSSNVTLGCRRAVLQLRKEGLEELRNRLATARVPSRFECKYSLLHPGCVKVCLVEDIDQCFAVEFLTATILLFQLADDGRRQRSCLFDSRST